MNDSTWQRAKEIFDTARGLAGHDLAEFLDRECADNEELRSQVETLLSSYKSDFLEKSALSTAEVLLGPTLTAGQIIGRYRIRELIGSGGMGQVLLADDTELNRPVAFKVLHRDVAQDEERVRRFIQEARAASALNHPNILTIHEIGSFEGAHFIVSEYVDGQTLRKRMQNGLTGAETIEITCQVAAALGAAHSAGIVHRDIKPENVMIRRDGLVKVLDFGLAKLTEADDHPIDPDAPVTHSSVQTSPGLIMGTVAYMSPEQALGQPVDLRTDLWSLGVVFHEMLTGRSPFEGESVTDIITSILESNRKPVPVEAVPTELQPICSKALATPKESRYQSAHDLLNDLKGVKKKMEYAIESRKYVTVSSADEKMTQVIGPRRPTLSTEYIVTSVKRHKHATLAAVLFVIAASVGLSVYRYNGATPPAAVSTLAVIDATTTEKDLKVTRFASSGRVIDIAISPDGTHVAYATGAPVHASLRVRDLTTQNDVEILPPPKGDQEAVFSSMVFTPDGTHILFRDGGPHPSVILKVPVNGGSLVKITDNSGAASVSPDGKTIALYRYLEDENHKWMGADLVLNNVDGTNIRTLVHTPSTDSWIETDVPAWSSDGKWLAAWQHFKENGQQFYKLYAISTTDGSKRDFGDKRWDQISSAVWMPDGSMVICAHEFGSPGFSPYQLWRVTESSSKAITSDANGYTKLSATRDGSMLAAIQSYGRRDLWRMDGTDAASARQITFSGELSAAGGISSFPDGKVVVTSVITNSRDLWLISSDGNGRKRLTDRGTNIDPHVTPDGRYIVFSSDKDSKAGGHIFRMDPDGGNIRQLNDKDYTRVVGVSSDSRFVFYRVMQKADKGVVYKVPIDGGPSSIVFKTDPDGGSYDVFPSDGRIAELYISGDEKVKEIRIYSPDSPHVKHLLLPFTTAGGIIHWTPDGRAVVFRDIRNEGANLFMISADGKTGATPFTNFNSPTTGDCAWSTDGKQLIVSRVTLTNDAMIITNPRQDVP